MQQAFGHGAAQAMIDLAIVGLIAGGVEAQEGRRGAGREIMA
jgi:hypothetical protein